jgi:hypothetical protein
VLGVVVPIPTFPPFVTTKLVAVELPTTNAGPVIPSGFTESWPQGVVEPKPTLPFVSIVCLTTAFVPKYTGAAFEVPRNIREAAFDAGPFGNMKTPLFVGRPKRVPPKLLPANAKVKKEPLELLGFHIVNPVELVSPPVLLIASGKFPFPREPVFPAE